MTNQCCLIGRIGNVNELKDFENGDNFLSFSLATNEDYKTKNQEKKEITNWHKIYAYGKLAKKLAEQSIKGKLVYVQGPLRYYKADQKNENSSKASYIRIEKFKYLSTKNNEGSNE